MRATLHLALGVLGLIAIAPRHKPRWISVAAALVALPSAGHAVAIYTYQGATYYSPGAEHTSDMRVTGELTFDAPLAPNLDFADVSAAVTDFHFNDGYWDFKKGVFTPTANLYSPTAQLSTDALGAIVGPYSISIRAGTYDPYLLIDQGGATAGHFGSGPCAPPCSREPARAYAGTWSTTSVPEPSTALLVIAGLAAIVGHDNRRSRFARGSRMKQSQSGIAERRGAR